jgi:hypothetical protein
MSRCAGPFARCYSLRECRAGFEDFLGTTLVSETPDWNETDVGLRLKGSPAQKELTAAVHCWLLACYCQPLNFSATDNSMEPPPAAYYRQALSAAEMASILELADQLQQRAVPRAFGGMVKLRDGQEGPSDDNAGSSSRTTKAAGVVGHIVTQLMPEFQLQFTELFAKLRRLVLAADEERGWGIIDPVYLVPRTIELLRYKAELGANLGWHMDKSSTVTLLAMLSDSNEYSGGILQHESRGVVHDTHLRRGDVAVYRSHQRHHVTTVTSGERVSLAIEFWHINPRSAVQLHGGINGALERGIKTDGRPELSHPIAPYFDLCPR